MTRPGYVRFNSPARCLSPPIRAATLLAETLPNHFRLAVEDAPVAELSAYTYERIKTFCKRGDLLAKAGKYPLALKQYWAAWDLLSEPKTDWNAATWILAAIGDANFLGGDYAAGRDNLSMAMHCPDAIGNVFLHLRLGQCQFELGNLDQAADELARAYMGAGAKIFKDADKYFAFLKNRLKPPPDGWQEGAR